MSANMSDEKAFYIETLPDGSERLVHGKVRLLEGAPPKREECAGEEAFAEAAAKYRPRAGHGPLRRISEEEARAFGRK